MPLSARTRRLRLYSYSDTGSNGRREQTFVKQASSASDGDWWGSLVAPGGREVNIAAQKGYSVDAVIGLGPAAPVTSLGLVKDVASGAIYKVTAVLSRDVGRDEQQVMAERVDEAEYQLDDFVAGWRTNSNIALLAEARGQDTTQQVVRSTIGPDGWLGNAPNTTQNDPSYATDPPRWVFGTMTGPGVWFGDVLNEVFNDPTGFTMTAVINWASIGGGHTIADKDRDSGGSATGVFMHMISGFLQMDVHYDGTGGLIARDVLSTPAPVQALGWQTVGADFDIRRPRGSRGHLYLGGAVTPSVEVQDGVDGTSIITTGCNLKFAGHLGSGLPGPEAGALLVLTRSVMPASFHAELHAEAVARGYA